MNQELQTALYLLWALNWASEKDLSSFNTEFEPTAEALQKIKGFVPSNEKLFGVMQEEFPDCALSKKRSFEIFDVFKKSRTVTDSTLVDFLRQLGGRATTDEMAEATGLAPSEVDERLTAVQKKTGLVRDVTASNQ